MIRHVHKNSFQVHLPAYTVSRLVIVHQINQINSQEIILSLLGRRSLILSQMSERHREKVQRKAGNVRAIEMGGAATLKHLQESPISTHTISLSFVLYLSFTHQTSRERCDLKQLLSISRRTGLSLSPVLFGCCFFFSPLLFFFCFFCSFSLTPSISAPSEVNGC